MPTEVAAPEEAYACEGKRMAREGPVLEECRGVYVWARSLCYVDGRPPRPRGVSVRELPKTKGVAFPGFPSHYTSSLPCCSVVTTLTPSPSPSLPHSHMKYH